jgi:hypothetical protein
MLKHIIILAVLVNLTVLSMGQSTASDKILDEYQWENRILLVFADSRSSKNYEHQNKELDGHAEGFKERDLKIFHLFTDDEQQVNQKKTQALYTEYEVAQGEFTVILIGKDGTEKLRTSELLEVKKLFSVIDAMPMRQREMRQES